MMNRLRTFAFKINLHRYIEEQQARQQQMQQAQQIPMPGLPAGLPAGAHTRPLFSSS